ncbi:MAG: ferrous iron transport protein B [Flavobacterium sp.]
MEKSLNIALIGNPNTGKTSIFNKLTGANQQVGNYPGITTQKKTGSFELPNGSKVNLIDLPGTYSLNTQSIDEKVALNLLLDPENENYPDLILVVSEVENLKRNLLLFTQIKDLNIPSQLIINMEDIMLQKKIKIDLELLQELLKTKISLISTRNNKGLGELLKNIENYKEISTSKTIDLRSLNQEFFRKIDSENIYENWLKIANEPTDDNKNLIKKIQHQETIKRYQYIQEILKQTYLKVPTEQTEFTSKLDKILTHKIFGFIIYLFLLILIFQAIFDWSEVPKSWIENGMNFITNYALENLPKGVLNDLITQGLLAGITGVLIFIPQIAFLFLFLSILEESGYMSRVVYIMDKIMKPFGLSGKSVVPLLSGNACAIPAIMATRNIENWKERIVTILVTPFTTCSARIPVYTIIIGLIIPNDKFLGIIGKPALVLMLLYLLGFFTAILAALILSKMIKYQYKNYFIIELPNYKMPFLNNVALNVYEKTKSFVFGAGQIIVLLSIILWFLGSHGYSDRFKNAETIVKSQNIGLESTQIEDKIASYQLENSYLGTMGKLIEPVIKPLGYDWKIGIALIASFAAREVFVSTLSTIYSINSASEDTITIAERMKKEINPETKKPVYSFATGISILLFYAFAMQCISTIAIVKKETNSWKYTLLQTAFMTLFAYFSAWLAYGILS